MYLYTVAIISLDTETVFAEDNLEPFNVYVVVSVDGDTHCPMDFKATFIVSFIGLSGECALRQCMLITKFNERNGEDHGNFVHNETEICRNVTFEPCESIKCVDLKTVFNISDDEEFHVQKFNISILPLEQEVEEHYRGKVIVSEELVEVEIDDDDDDRELIYRFFK